MSQTFALLFSESDQFIIRNPEKTKPDFSLSGDRLFQIYPQKVRGILRFAKTYIINSIQET